MGHVKVLLLLTLQLTVLCKKFRVDFQTRDMKLGINSIDCAYSHVSG